MDYYETLQISPDVSQDEIKKAYQKLILQHHPDKSEGSSSLFIRIDEAYKVLKEPLKRKEYDSQQFEKQRSHLIIHDTVAKTDFNFDEANEVYYHVCKCGGWYILEEDATDKEYIICCDECSLVIRVTDTS